MATTETAACPICGEDVVRTPASNSVDWFQCGTCGTYRISDGAVEELRSGRYSGSLHLLSALLRSHHERGQATLLHTKNIEEILESASSPQTLPEALESLLLYVGERQKRFSDYVQIESRKFPIAVASSFEDFRYVADLLLQSGYAEVYDDAVRDQFRLTPAGWTRLNELRAARPDSSQAFVAMWFADDLTPAWDEGIRPGLVDAGYTAVRLDAVEHNEKIDDRIIAEIRRSGLVVADLTGGRANVYFEAGFAMGLGIPVIWTCRDDHLDDLHFDTRQYNYIAWSTPAELRERLRLRIEATLPRKAEARR